MVTYKHNEPYYELHLSELSEDAVHVFSFQGEEQISRLFKYCIELISSDAELDPKDILNKKASFVMNRGDEDPIYINGIISHFEQRGRTPNYVFYYAELVPKMWRLGLTHQSQIFQNMDIKKIVTQVLDDAGFSGQDYEFKLDGSYPELEYVVQYQETDFDFINRRLEHFGIFYYFDHRGDNDVIVFTDTNDQLPAIDQSEDIYYNPNRDPLFETETISELSCKTQVVTGLIRLKDYNYRFPTRNLMVESQIDQDSPGTYYEYGGHFKDATEGDSIVKVRNEEILVKSEIFSGKSDCRLLRVGNKFKMGMHYREEWNDTNYVLTKVISRGTQRGLFNLLSEAKKVTPTYENYFEAIPIDIQYRPPRITAVPRIPGIMTAKLESGAGDEYAFVDDQGQYRMKSPFDLSDKGNGEASRAVRLAQPYSGPGYGIHFPNHADAEIVWSCIDGNVDRPLGIGTVPNPSQSSPVVLDNKPQSIIRTAAGNEMIMDDKTDEAQIRITTPDSNKILFDDKDDKIELTTTEKHIVTFDDKNKNITVKTKDGHLLIMDDKNTKITVQSTKGHHISINDSSGGEMITLMDKDKKNIFVIDITNNKLVIKTEDGSIDMHAPNGTIDVKAKTFNLETSADTTIKADANISTEAGGNYDLKAGGNISEEATGDFAMKGTNVKSEASMDHNSKGMNVNVKGDMNTNIEAGMNLVAKGSMAATFEGGMTADLKGGAKTAITGGIVMIN
jgi:type VI secretion system secreted protein VgrG